MTKSHRRWINSAFFIVFAAVGANAARSVNFWLSCELGIKQQQHKPEKNSSQEKEAKRHEGNQQPIGSGKDHNDDDDDDYMVVDGAYQRGKRMCRRWPQRRRVYLISRKITKYKEGQQL